MCLTVVRCPSVYLFYSSRALCLQGPADPISPLLTKLSKLRVARLWASLSLPLISELAFTVTSMHTSRPIDQFARQLEISTGLVWLSCGVSCGCSSVQLVPERSILWDSGVQLTQSRLCCVILSRTIPLWMVLIADLCHAVGVHRTDHSSDIYINPQLGCRTSVVHETYTRPHETHKPSPSPSPSLCSPPSLLGGWLGWFKYIRLDVTCVAPVLIQVFPSQRLHSDSF